ncbi:hypothetical protein ERJ75_001499500 [Trypanosoma vivax]|nr:hypothetical protein ERJ75_001499500 [Trypanosoma vivax]
MRRQRHSLGLVECHRQVQGEGFGGVENVTELRKRGEEVEAKASKAIAEYNELLGALGTTTAAHITSNIETAVREAKNAIAVASNSYANATAAEKSPNSSLEDGVIDSFNAIMLASRVFSGYTCPATVNYNKTKK